MKGRFLRVQPYSLGLLIILAFSLNVRLTHGAEAKGIPAVVNPATRSSLRPTLSLDGDWDFTTDPAGVGEDRGWFKPGNIWPNRTTLQVPGCWEAQGVGGPRPSVSYAPERSQRTLRGTYRGTAWYRKSILVPTNWAGRQIWLKIGGVHSQGWFWINGNYVASNACYCGTYKYNITDLFQPGSPAVIVAKVRNDVPSLKGLMGHVERFGGLYRSVELEATPNSLIDDVYVAGDFDQQTAVVNVTLHKIGTANPTTNQLQILVTTPDGKKAGMTNVSFTLADTNAVTTNLSLRVPLNLFRAWSPEVPNLYRADVVLTVNGQTLDGWSERFGVRKWEVRGGNYYLNNQKYFIRGFGDDYVYPITLCSPASLAVHRQHLQMAKAYGFNYVRHHTHCEVPEFYEAADEVGIMVQPELPYYGSQPSAGSTNYFQPQADLTELYTHYRRYVSLSTYCMGNEGNMGSDMSAQLYQLAKTLDPSRLAIHQDGGRNTRSNADFYQSDVLPWAPGKYDASWPYDAHEYMNLATEEDPRLAGQYTGTVLPPVTPEQFQINLANTPLSWNWGMATLDAGNQLQSLYQKRGLEQARLDPACDGYIYWTIIDIGAPSAQGLFNQFWQPKASTVDFFSQFNGPTAILANFTPSNRILTCGDILSAQWWISAFGANLPKSQTLVWSLQQDGNLLASGQVDSVSASVGDVKPIGTNSLVIPTLGKAAKLKIVAAIPTAAVTNSWDLWVFPRWVPVAGSGQGMAASSNLFSKLQNRYPGLTHFTDPAQVGIDVVLVDVFDALAAQAMSKGKTVLLLGLRGPKPGVAPGWWTLSPQAGTAVAHHPAFGDFPHDGYVNELFFRLVNNTSKATAPELRKVEPLMVGRGSAGYLLHVFQATNGGKLLASGLDLLAPYAESVYLRDQFIRYARSPAFAPTGSIDPLHPGFLSASLGNSVSLAGIKVFNATNHALNNRGNQGYAIDRDLSTLSYLTPAYTTGPQMVAFDLGKPVLVNRLRVAKQGECDEVAGADNYNLAILYSTNTGPLNQRRYQCVTNLTNGYNGQELISADKVSSGGIVQRDHHDFDSQGFYSLTFAPVTATAIAIRFERDSRDPKPFTHYAIFEAEVYAAISPPK